MIIRETTNKFRLLQANSAPALNYKIMLDSSDSLINIKFLFEDQQKSFLVGSNTNLADLLIRNSGNELFAICYGENQMLIPTEIDFNLVVKRSTQDSSVLSLFVFDEEIISTNESFLTIKLKKISKFLNHYSFIPFNFFYSF